MVGSASSRFRLLAWRACFRNTTNVQAVYTALGTASWIAFFEVRTLQVQENVTFPRQHQRRCWPCLHISHGSRTEPRLERIQHGVGAIRSRLLASFLLKSLIHGGGKCSSWSAVQTAMVRTGKVWPSAIRKLDPCGALIPGMMAPVPRASTHWPVSFGTPCRTSIRGVSRTKKLRN